MQSQHPPPHVLLHAPNHALLALFFSLMVASPGCRRPGMRMLMAAALITGPTTANASVDAAAQTRLDAALRCHPGSAACLRTIR